jgi:hypothetical protein
VSRVRTGVAVCLLGLAAALPVAEASAAAQACKPFDVAEVRKVLHLQVGPPHAAGGASMLSCTAGAGGAQVTLSHTPEPNLALGSAGEFNQSVAGARAAGQVQVQEFKDTRCALIHPSGGNKFGTFKAWCVLHSRKGRYVSLEVTGTSAKQLPPLEKLREAAEAAAARIP